MQIMQATYIHGMEEQRRRWIESSRMGGWVVAQIMAFLIKVRN